MIPVVTQARDHGPLYFISWAGDPPSALLICRAPTLSRGSPQARGAPRTHPTAARFGLLCKPPGRPGGDTAARPQWGPDAQGCRCKGARAGEAKRAGPDRRGVSWAPAAAARGAHPSPPVVAQPAETRVRHPAPGGFRGCRASRPGHRDWTAASPGSR